MARGVLIVLGLLLLHVPSADGAIADWFRRGYSYPGAEGWVVDAETGQPLGGVVLQARWYLMDWFHGGASTMLQMDHATTDARGRFHLRPWGPLRPPSGMYLPYHEQAKAYAPTIYTFKVGYVMERGALRAGITIRLKPFRGTDAEWLEELKSATTLGRIGDVAAFAPHHGAMFRAAFPELLRLAARYPEAAKYLRDFQPLLESDRRRYPEAAKYLQDPQVIPGPVQDRPQEPRP